MTGRRKLDPLRLPQEGSLTRRVYDALLSGDPVCVKSLTGHHTSRRTVADLRDNYNCEIEGKGGPHGYTRLLGRWDGPYFVPVERLQGFS